MIYQHPKIDYETKYENLRKEYEKILKINETLKMELSDINNFLKVLDEYSVQNNENSYDISDTIKKFKETFLEYENKIKQKDKEISEFKEILKLAKDNFDNILIDLRDENHKLNEQINILSNK